MSEFNPREHLMVLKGGKEYLQVAWRLVWFREEHPDWTIVTDMLSDTVERCVFRAQILDAEGKLLAVGHGSETTKDFKDNLEKAETKAIGRALAILGYGTQFAPEIVEIDDGVNERLADAPIPVAKPKAIPKAPEAPKGEKSNEVPLEEIFVECEMCKQVIRPYISPKNGKPVSAQRHINGTMERFGKKLCADCVSKMTKRVTLDAV